MQVSREYWGMTAQTRRLRRPTFAVCMFQNVLDITLENAYER